MSPVASEGRTEGLEPALKDRGLATRLIPLALRLLS